MPQAFNPQCHTLRKPFQQILINLKIVIIEKKKTRMEKKQQLNKPHRTRKTKRHKTIKTAALHYKNCVQKKAHFPRPSAELPSPSVASAVTAIVGRTSDHTVKPVSPKAPTSGSSPVQMRVCVCFFCFLSTEVKGHIAQASTLISPAGSAMYRWQTHEHVLEQRWWRPYQCDTASGPVQCSCNHFPNTCQEGPLLPHPAPLLTPPTQKEGGW